VSQRTFQNVTRMRYLFVRTGATRNLSLRPKPRIKLTIETKPVRLRDKHRSRVATYQTKNEQLISVEQTIRTV
jgi:hypothetical protein